MYKINSHCVHDEHCVFEPFPSFSGILNFFSFFHKTKSRQSSFSAPPINRSALNHDFQLENQPNSHSSLLAQRPMINLHTQYYCPTFENPAPYHLYHAANIQHKNKTYCTSSITAKNLTMSLDVQKQSFLFSRDSTWPSRNKVLSNKQRYLKNSFAESPLNWRKCAIS